MTGQLVQPFPMPVGDELRKAYNELALAANADEETKKRLGKLRLLARPWDPPTCTRPELRRELWDWLDQVVTWFNHEYVWDHNAGMIPPCWPQHPHLVHEIAVLADQRRRAGLDVTSSGLEEWHRYGAVAFLDRLKARTKNGCDEHHSTWPAERRYGRHTSRTAAAERASLFAGDIEGINRADPEPVSEPSPPVLHLVRNESGDLMDPETGEVF